MFAGISSSDLKLADFYQKIMMQDKKSAAETELGKTSAGFRTDDIIKIGVETKGECSTIKETFEKKGTEDSDERDLNKDGQITISEIAEYYDSMREKLGILSIQDITTNIAREMKSLKDEEKAERETEVKEKAEKEVKEKKETEASEEKTDEKKVQEKKPEHVTTKNEKHQPEMEDTPKKPISENDKKEFISNNKDKIADLNAPTYKNGLKKYIMSNFEQKQTSFVEKSA